MYTGCSGEELKYSGVRSSSTQRNPQGAAVVAPVAQGTFTVAFKLNNGKNYYIYGDGAKLPIYFLGLEEKENSYIK